MKAKRKRVALGSTFFEERINLTLSKIIKGFSPKMGVGLDELLRFSPHLSS